MGETAAVEGGAELEAGRALDALVAERVMGEVCGHAPVGDGLSRTSQYYAPTLAEVDAIIRVKFAAHKLWPAQYCGPEYSTDIAAAWEVVEKLGLSVVRSEDGWYALKPEDIEHGSVRGTDFPEITLVLREHDYPTPAETAPHAIALAALKLHATPPTSGPTEPTPGPFVSQEKET